MAIPFYRTGLSYTSYQASSVLVGVAYQTAVPGDVLISVIVAQSDPQFATTPVITTPALQTRIGYTTITLGGNPCKVATYYRVFTGGNEADTFSFDRTSDVAWSCTCYGSCSGVNTLSTSSVASGAASTSAVATACTTTFDNSMVIVATGSGAASSTPPGGMTERFDQYYNSPLLATISDVVQSVAGTTGTKTTTLISSTEWASTMFVLKPDGPSKAEALLMSS